MTASRFEETIENPLWTRVNESELPGELQSGKIISVYTIDDGYTAVLLDQTWLPYSWNMNKTDWEIMHVSTELVGGFKIPILGYVMSRTGLLVRLSE